MKQMNTLKTIALALVSSLTLIACQNNSDSKRDDSQYNLANVPMSSQCQAGNNTYGGANWNQYSNAGFQPYNQYNNQYNGGYNNQYGGQYNSQYNGGYQNQQGCGPGFITICDARFGLICAPSQSFPSARFAWYGYGSGAIRFHGYGGSSYGYPSYPSYYGGGYNQIGFQAGYNTNSGFYFGRTCSVGFNSCGSGKFCQATNVASPVGVCVENRQY